MVCIKNKLEKLQCYRTIYYGTIATTIGWRDCAVMGKSSCSIGTNPRLIKSPAFYPQEVRQMNTNKLNIDSIWKETWREKLWNLVPYRWKEIWRKVESFFNPCHKKVRKAFPKTWTDITELIRLLNFAMLVEFYEEEFLDGWVDWDSDEEHREFKRWLIDSYRYITEERPKLEKAYWDALPPADDFFNQYTQTRDNEGRIVWQAKGDAKTCYEAKYGKANSVEAEIEMQDSLILVEMMKRRDRFWT